jgi:mannose-6-phosphate isomerase-like protein (cupin superfamily)
LKENIMQLQNEDKIGVQEDRALWVLGELVTYRLAAEQSGGASSVFEVLVHPQGGPPPHIQHREDEWAYVLEGEFELLYKDRTISGGPGTLVYVPKGTLHTYKNTGEEPGRLLVGQTPAGLLQGFFDEVGETAVDRNTPPAMDGPPDVGRIVATAARYGMEIPPPPSA